MLYNKVFEWWLRNKWIINWGHKIFYKNGCFWKIGSKWGQSNSYIPFCEFSWKKFQSLYRNFRFHGMLCGPLHLGQRLVKRLPPTPNFHRLKFKLARFQFAFRLRNPEYELVKSALTDFDLSASGVHAPLDLSWCAKEKKPRTKLDRPACGSLVSIWLEHWCRTRLGLWRLRRLC